jgi:hypothetical protein
MDPEVARQAMLRRAVVPPFATSPIEPSITAGAGLSNAARVAGGLQPPAQPAAAAQPNPQPTPPPPTDDPTLTRLHEATTEASQALGRREDKLQGIEGNLENLQPPNYKEQFQPHGWRRALGIGLGLVPLAPAQIASAELLRVPQYNRAMNQYGHQRTGLLDQLAAEREAGIPLASDRARVAQEAFQNELAMQREKRETGEAASREKLWESRAQQYGDKFIEGTEKDDPTSPTGKVAQTFNGEWKPWSPRLATQKPGGEKFTNSAEAFGAAASTDDSKLKAQYTAQAKAMKQREDEEEHTRHPDQAIAGGMNANQQREFTTRTRTLQRQMDALDKEKAEYTRMQAQAMLSGVQLPGSAKVTEYLSGLDQKRADLQKQIDDIETEILTRGSRGESGKVEGKSQSFSVPKGAPAPSKEKQQLQDKTKKSVLAVAIRDPNGNLKWGPPGDASYSPGSPAK